jgi:DNA-directed RNA polymerase sigma subunit (sigma70/sigma32)
LTLQKEFAILWEVKNKNAIMDYQEQLKMWEKRRLKMIENRKKGITLEEIGKLNGISKQRVIQILEKERSKELDKVSK